ncbi:MAG: hypothetical protein JWP52_1514 [Rhizobacter sp.]|nr:hypothetical protein [Rhizobacter sp.]
MERLLMLRLQATGCAAEVLLNGMPVATLGAAGGLACMAVHEYTLTGVNRLELVVGPPPATQPPGSPPMPRIAKGPIEISAQLVLLRHGYAATDAGSRPLASVEWKAAEGDSYEAPTVVAKDVELPVKFQRWRWLDAPPVVLTPAVRRQLLEFVQGMAASLGRGDPEPLIDAARLRFEELALAYQRTPGAEVQRFRDRLQKLYLAKALTMDAPTAETLVLRPLLKGQLIECLTPLGTPALRTGNMPPAAMQPSWPLRLAVVEQRVYVLR